MKNYGHDWQPKTTLREMDKWISVKDRLPQIPQDRAAIRVLVCDETMAGSWNEYGVSIAWYYPDGFRSLGVVPKVTHWQPLPPPPRGEDQ